jgi:hypothetical protein
MKQTIVTISIFFLFTVLACRKNETSENITHAVIRSVVFPDENTDLYYYDGKGRVSSIFHSGNGTTDEYTYSQGYFDVITKDSTKSPSPGGYLRVELVNTLISSIRTGVNGSGPRVDSFTFNTNRMMSWRLHTPDSRTSEEYKYFYNNKNILDSMHVYSGRTFLQSIVYEYDYRVKNALTNKNFGLVYHGGQTPFPLSFRKIYRNGSKPIVEAYQYEYDGNGRISKMITTAAFGKPQVTKYTYY